MLVVSVLRLQGVDPETVKFPLESVPLKLKVVVAMAFTEFVIVPVSAVPVCDTVILPIAAARVVAPLTPRPCPDCDMAAVPEKLPWPWVDTAFTVQVPAIFKAELLEAPLPPQAVRKNAMPAARSTLRLTAAMRFICFALPMANYKRLT
jgi:hypothetical protein